MSAQAQPDDEMALAVRAAKKALRKEITASLRVLPDEILVEQSSRVSEFILNHRLWRDAKRLSIYLSTDHAELRTDALVAAALQQGKAVFVPHCPSPSVMRMLRLRTADELAGLSRNAWGIREHVVIDGLEEALDSGQAGLDLILAPGLAFDRHRNRLGHGRGYYDRYIQLATVHASQHGLQPPAVVALALDEQLLPPDQTVPFSSHDRKVDLLVTPRGILDEQHNELQ